jgi:AraC family transcriptional regulator, regulatory protein of adaptative response / methylated-DNA-[protein]-cysteine methyltransferase
MRDTIRFTWGTSSLGDFLVAMSNQGLVALEFADERTVVERALRIRFPESLLIAEQEGLAEILGEVHQVIEGAEHDSRIPLDLRGTAYEVKVWQRLRMIPTGESTNYGALAAEFGTRDAREVTDAISANPIAILVPCHRVIKKDGSISGYRWGAGRKRVLLDREKKLHKALA